MGSIVCIGPRRCPSARQPTATAAAPASPAAAEAILSKEPELKADFSRAQQAMSKARQKGVPRYLPNPGELAWGQ